MAIDQRKGFIKFWRSYVQDQPLSGAIEIGAYTWMLCQASHEAISVRYKNHVWPLRKGQFVTSIRDMSNTLNLSHRRTRTLIQRFKKNGLIDTQSDTRSTIVTICDYGISQGKQEITDIRSDIDPTQDRHTADTQNKKVRIKEIKNPRNVSPLLTRPISIQQVMNNHIKEGGIKQ
jgi:predicted transcriptional regulator